MDRKIKHTFQFKTEEDLVRKLVDIYTSMLTAGDSTWLTPREKDLFVQYVLLHRAGRNLIDKKSVELLNKNANFKPTGKGLSIYKGRLINKGWIHPTKEGITIPSTFDYIFKNGKVCNLNVGLSLKYEHNDNDR